MERFLNLSLRALTILFKSLLIFYIAKFLSPKDMALYGLVIVTIGYLVYILGLDYYTYYTREMAKTDVRVWGKIIKSVSLFFVFSYFICSIILVVLYYNYIIPKQLIFVFVLILITEHLNQEIQRVMIMHGDVLHSSIIVFIRYGVWSPLVITLIHFGVLTRNINSVFWVWGVFGILALLLAILRLAKYGISGWQEKIDKKWLLQGTIICIPFLLGALSLRGIFTFDRFWLKAYYAVEYLAAYTFFSSFANIIGTVLESLLVAYTYPKLIKLFHEANMNEYNKEIHKFTMQIIYLSVAFTIFLAMMTWLFVRLAGLDKYEQFLPMYWLILATAVINGLATVPHYILYSQNKDKVIYLSHIAGFFAFIAGLFLISPQFSSGYIVVIVVMLSYLFIFFCKTLACYKICRFS